MSRVNNVRFILLVKLAAIISFVLGSIGCAIIHERDMAMAFMASSLTGFSTLFVNPHNSSGGGNDNNDEGGNGGGGGRKLLVPGSDLVERPRRHSDRSIIKGRIMEVLALAIIVVVMAAVNINWHP